MKWIHGFTALGSFAIFSVYFVLTFYRSYLIKGAVTYKITTTAKEINPTKRTIHDYIKCNNCTHFNFGDIISNDRICHTKGHRNSDVFMVILVASAQQNVKARDALRKTWLSPWKNNTGLIRYVFVLGWSANTTLQSSILEENSEYGDLLQYNFTDSYHNLTIKTMMGFHWVLQTCSHARYIFKADDDTFVNVKNLIKTIKKSSMVLQHSVGGYCAVNPMKNSDKSSKWYVSDDTYPFSTFPGYCSGSGYVTSIVVIQKILKIHHDIAFIFLEDVYVGFCISSIGFNFTTFDGFHPVKVVPVACSYRGNDMVTSHYISPTLMTSIWNMHCEKGAN